MKHTLEATENLAIRQDTAESLIFENIDGVDTVVGVTTPIFGEFRAKRVIITSGTFLNGLIHIGEKKISAGRAGDAPSWVLLNLLGISISELED